MKALANAWSALRAEGPRAFAARALDRTADRRRAAAYLEVSAATLQARWHRRMTVLHVLGVPPLRSSGGVEQQFLARLDVERLTLDTACLLPGVAHWRLEVASPLRQEVAMLSRRAATDAFSDSLREALTRTGATVLHVENPAGLPLDDLAFAATVTPTVLSIHDFSLFCPRPHLLPVPPAGGCGWNDTGCALCTADPATPPEYGPSRQAAARRLLAAARAIVLPSQFLARETAARLAVDLSNKACIIQPALALPQLPALTGIGAGGPHVAYVGSLQEHKGGAVLLAVAPALIAAGCRVSAYGGGDARLIDALRTAGVRVRGYYRAGSLTTRLRSDRVDLALLLSIWPESHGLTLDECAAAGVTALAFDQGALGERLRDRGLLVDPAAGAAGVIAAVRGWMADRATDQRRPPETSTPAAAARAYSQLYRELAGSTALR